MHEGYTFDAIYTVQYCSEFCIKLLFFYDPRHHWLVRLWCPLISSFSREAVCVLRIFFSYNFKMMALFDIDQVVIV